MKCIILAVIFFGTAPLFSLPLDAFLDAESAQVLREGGEETRNSFDSAQPLFAPRYAPLTQALDAAIAECRPNVFTETLRLFPKPAVEPAWTNEARASIYNGIIALGTLAGIEYFSRRRGKMRTLYETSTVIDAPGTKKAQPDPQYPPEQIPASLTLYARQKDGTFGDNVYEYTYSAGEGAFLIAQKNLSTLTLAIIPAVGKGNLRTHVALIDTDEGILVYAASIVRVMMLPGLKDQVSASINNRADALLEWFAARVNAAYPSRAD